MKNDRAGHDPRSNLGLVPYRGRFAPSPTGPLHFGSLVAAVGSYLCARVVHGEWHVRIDDVDRTRTIPGADADILKTLETFGFEWTGPIVRQSERTRLYAEALHQLRTQGAVFECSCSRRELALLVQPSADGEDARYPGFCRGGPRNPQLDKAIRFRVPTDKVTFRDLFQGDVTIDVSAEAGDFVVRRRDGLFAYQLACAVDDADQGFTEIVRGADLLPSTARQILLQRALGYGTPTYGHLAIVLDDTGRKLSKSTQAPGLSLTSPHEALWRALRFLRQDPPSELFGASVGLLWKWAVRHWRPQTLVGISAERLPG